MQAGEKEVLNALRIHSRQSASSEEWADIYLHDARNDFTLAWMSEKSFHSILSKLTMDGLYKPLDEDSGSVKMI